MLTSVFPYVYVNTYTINRKEKTHQKEFVPFAIFQVQTYYKTLSKGNRKKELPDLQTDSCNVVIWPGCLSAHTFAPGYQSHSTSLLKQLPSDTVPGKLSTQKKKLYQTLSNPEKEMTSNKLIFDCKQMTEGRDQENENKFEVFTPRR